VTQAAEAAQAVAQEAVRAVAQEAVRAVAQAAAYLPRGPDHRRTTGAAPIVAKRRCPSPNLESHPPIHQVNVPR
jgi:hypothetical protein